MWRSRFFWRFFGAAAVPVVGSIGVLTFVIVGRVEDHQLRQIEDALRARAVLLREAIPAAGDLQPWARSLRAEAGSRITLVAADGRVLADSEEEPQTMENHGERPEVRAAQAERFGTATRFSTTLHVPMMYVALRTDRPGPVAFVRLALPLDAVREQSAWLRRAAAGTAGLTALAALASALFLARRLVRPLEELTAGARRIAAGEYGQKVYAAGADEVGVLAQAFNDMSRRLADQFAQLAEDRQQLQMILSGMVEGVVALDAEQRVLFANERAARLLGTTPNGLVERKLWEVVRVRPLQDLVRRALSGSGPCTEEVHNPGPPAQCLTVHAAPLTGSPRGGALLVLHDTTDLRKLERLRQEFVANVSHELKTPLSVIKACVETLEQGAADDPAMREKFLGRIAEQGDRLHALILDLLSLARVESGAEVFEFEPVPLRAAVADCLERHGARARARNQHLEMVAPDGDEFRAWADREAVNQILDNLVDNALKYTPEGGRIAIRCHGDNGAVGFDVQDSGVGIPSQDLPRIFERFYRVDKARARALGGTGLGLSIVKHLAQAMNGSVGATSEPGKGSTFSVRLPRAAP